MRGSFCVAVAVAALMPFAVLAAESSDTNVVWKSSVSLGATYKDGNTEKSIFTMNLKGDRYADKSDWLNSLYGEYGKTEGKLSEGQMRAQSDYRYKFAGENLFGGVFSEAYYDGMKKIRTRLKIGPNVGYYFINNETMKLNCGIGVNYAYERTAMNEDDYAEYRVAVGYLWDITETANYYFNMEYTANVEDVDQGEGLLVTGVKCKVNAKLATFIELRDEYDNMPDSGIEHNDTTVIVGLTYDF